MATEDQFYPTMQGDNSAEPAPDDSRLPADAHGAWRIELRHYPIAHRSHAFLTLVDPDGKVRGEEAGAGKGGQIQNINSAAYTYGKAMNLDLDSAIGDAGIERRFPGWGRNLVDPAYKPYVAPPMFPTENRQ